MEHLVENGDRETKRKRIKKAEGKLLQASEVSLIAIKKAIKNLHKKNVRIVQLEGDLAKAHKERDEFSARLKRLKQKVRELAEILIEDDDDDDEERERRKKLREEK
ncbi:hypothetical protein DEO72_LG2g4187 [Vigna unguiculata]|uniref:Uncharacterized protein n=1 Tax=Vigna unguiculata TaxID=3917 RepID=A0A4D6L5U6_VIGUN|nr:hypothetical protein DEO72_LG2g4187 [Vigna unguiculata]